MYIYSKNQKHKVFISFYHHDDEWYKNELERLFSDKMISKSVQDGEYDSDDSDEYVKRLIREDKISDSSVVVVLCGPNTKRRKHVDWEIYAGLRKSINGTSGLVGVLLPEFPLVADNRYSYSDIPGRLADNVKSEYANVYTWAYFKENFVSIIQDAFDNRIKLADRVNNSRIQMKRNL
jgi:hypothetical protein